MYTQYSTYEQCIHTHISMNMDMHILLVLSLSTQGKESSCQNTSQSYNQSEDGPANWRMSAHESAKDKS